MYIQSKNITCKAPDKEFKTPKQAI